MKILLLANTVTGAIVLRHLHRLRPTASITVLTDQCGAGEDDWILDLQWASSETGTTLYHAPSWDTLAYSYDYALAVNWRRLVSPADRRQLGRGLFVFHPSLLPLYRGFAPIPWQILNGAQVGGVTLFRATDAVDFGPILWQRDFDLGPHPTAGEYTLLVRDNIVSGLARVLALIEGGTSGDEQDHSLATYGARRVPDDGRIDWSRPAAYTERLVRALTRPFPGAWFYTDGGTRVTVDAAHVTDRRYVGVVPGQVAGPTSVLCGDGRVLEIDKCRDVFDLSLPTGHNMR